MRAILSIIVPCHKSEDTLEETLYSVLEQEYQNWEVIIVNDGSPDNVEEIALKWLSRDSRFKYLKKTNGGLGTARNYGIQKSIGDYILPLDSDNKIEKHFTERAINLLENDKKIGVVYGDAMYFGEKEGTWKVGSFNKYKLLYSNYIDACAVIRRTVFKDLGYYDDKIPFQGNEDWEFWLRIISSKFTFFYLEKITFYYRVTSTSMIRSFNQDMFDKNKAYIKNKHSTLYIDGLTELYFENERYKSKILKASFYFRFKQLIKKLIKFVLDCVD